MSLKKNTIANYAGQGYTALIVIIMMPLYLRYLGAEAYGLVGFFIVMQAWFGLLDMGLSPTLSRQIAHARGLQGDGQMDLRVMLRTIEWIFLLTGAAVAAGVWMGSPWIAAHWLKVKTLPISEVVYCIRLMGIMMGLRWFASLYRGGIQGMEQMVWLGGANIVIATLRYVGLYVLLRWITQAPAYFFDYELAISVVGLCVLAFKFYRCLPPDRVAARFSPAVFKRVLPFTGGMAYASAVWVLYTQIDKLILSKALSLKEFGYFTLVTVVSNGLISLIGPVSQAIMPRMTMLLSQGDKEAMDSVYHKATQFTASIVFPLAGTLTIFARQSLFAWTGSREASAWAGPVLSWYIMGTGILAVASFPYYLQYAYGKLKLHVLNNTVNVLVQGPVLAYAAFKYGAMGVAISWFVMRALWFSVFPYIVHRKFAPGIHGKWLKTDIFPSLAASLIVLGIINGIMRNIVPQGRLELLIVLPLTVIAAFTASVLASPDLRRIVLSGLRLAKARAL
ncbi:MAG: oligosaccharide flippase family protein [Nitrospiraceae bacterium]|nr:oligosaccharide flippase family protein [Nitrospiraceae bacterium]